MTGELTIRDWTIVISGFTQHVGRYSGMVRLAQRLIKACPKRRVEAYPWNTDWSQIAEWILLNRNGEAQDIVIAGYSFGGFSATLLASELERRGINVRSMVLCDAVYRHWYRAGWWRSLVPWSKITVPVNVEEVHVLRQTRPRVSFGRTGPIIQPAGHDVEPLSSLTTVHGPVDLGVDHVFADDHELFHETALRVSHG